jgi:hypothetical protein
VNDEMRQRGIGPDANQLPMGTAQTGFPIPSAMKQGHFARLEPCLAHLSGPDISWSGH